MKLKQQWESFVKNERIGRHEEDLKYLSVIIW